MLGNLIKHEMRQTARIIPLSFIPVAFFAVLFAIFASMGARIQVMIFGSFLITFGVVAMFFINAYVVIRFYKGVYGAEGYLTMTLPIPEKQIYASRVIAGLVWTVAGAVISTASYFYGFITMMELLADSAEDLAMVTATFGSGFKMIMFFGCIIGNMAFLLEAFLCVTLAHVRPFRKLGLGAAVLSYIVIYTVNQAIMLPLTFLVPLSVRFMENGGWELTNVSMWSTLSNLINAHGSSGTSPYIGIAGYIWPFVSIIVCPIVTTWLMRTKINLK